MEFPEKLDREDMCLFVKEARLAGLEADLTGEFLYLQEPLNETTARLRAKYVRGDECYHLETVYPATSPPGARWGLTLGGGWTVYEIP